MRRLLLPQTKQTHKRTMQLPKKMALHHKRKQNRKKVIKIKKENEKPLGEVLNNQIQWNLEHTVPHPTECVITKVYADNIHVDINTRVYGQITYVKTNGHPPVVDAEGILIFLNNNYNERRVII